MSTQTKIWLTVVLIYGSFWVWYSGFDNSMSPAEAQGYLAKLEAADLSGDVQYLKDMIEKDRGRSLVIVNLITLKEPKQESLKTLNNYSGPFMRKLFSKGGHPVFFARGAAPAVEYWGLEPGAEQWDLAVGVRYRSLKDMLDMATWDQFEQLHPYKVESIERTIAFPATPYSTLGGVKLTFALVLIISGLVAGRTLA